MKIIYHLIKLHIKGVQISLCTLKYLVSEYNQHPELGIYQRKILRKIERKRAIDQEKVGFKKKKKEEYHDPDEEKKSSQDLEQEK